VDTAERLLELAAQAGAELAEVYQSKSLSRPIFFEANRLKQLESAQSEGTALRLWKAGRPGLAVAFGPVDPQALVDKTIAISALNEPEAAQINPGSRKVYPDLGQEVAVDTLLGMGRSAIASLHTAFPEVLCSSQWDCEMETTRLINSLGLDCSYTDTTLSAYLAAEWIRGDDFLSIADGQTERGSLNPDQIVQQISQRLEWARKSARSPTGRMPVLFTAKAADLLWETVQAAISGKQVIEGASPWSDRLGQPVISDRLTLTQAPNEGPYSCPFDDEGTPTRPLTFIKKGVLQLFYADKTIGEKLGSGSTGSAFRPGLGSYPTPGLVNLLIAPGQSSLAEMIAQLDNGLIVDQILGGGAGISGDFSVNVDLGYLVKRGEIVGRVKDTMVSGNAYHALKNVVALGNDGDWNGPCHTPSILVEGLSVTAND
jgi:PmbA protein